MAIGAGQFDNRSSRQWQATPLSMTGLLVTSDAAAMGALPSSTALYVLTMEISEPETRTLADEAARAKQ